jgi:hypothetical protein
MSYLNNIVYLILIFANSAMPETRCTHYSEGWRIAKCAATLKEQDLITTPVFVDYLRLAISKEASQTDFYGVGLTLGMENNLVIGKIKSPVVDGGMIIPVSPSAIYFTSVIVDLGIKTEKPVVLYLVKSIEGLPLWRRNFMSKLLPTGGETQYAIFSDEESGVITPNTPEDCSGYQRWMDENISKTKGIAIVLGPGQWCPVIKKGLAEVVVAELIEEERVNMKGEIEKTYRALWAKTPTEKFGKIPEMYNSVFL